MVLNWTSVTLSDLLNLIYCEQHHKFLDEWINLVSSTERKMQNQSDLQTPLTLRPAAPTYTTAYLWLQHPYNCKLNRRGWELKVRKEIMRLMATCRISKSQYERGPFLKQHVTITIFPFGNPRKWYNYSTSDQVRPLELRWPCVQFNGILIMSNLKNCNRPAVPNHNLQPH